MTFLSTSPLTKNCIILLHIPVVTLFMPWFLCHAECSVTDLVHLNNVSYFYFSNETNQTCQEIVNSVSISPGTGVVCYNGTSVGSTAIYIYICNHSNQTNVVTRVCQSNGTWNGTIPSCPGIITCSCIHFRLCMEDGILPYFLVRHQPWVMNSHCTVVSKKMAS